MANSWFQFKQFIIHQDRCAMKVTTDSCLFGAWAAGRIRNERSITTTCLDIGTGSGLLSLMLAQTIESHFDAIEIDKDAFEQAVKNTTASPWVNRINVIHADAKEFKFQKKYDIIISNPPFYEQDLKGDNVKKNLAHHNEGLLLPAMLNIIKKNLKQGGCFYLLLPYKRNAEIKKLVIENNLAVQQLIFIRQSANHDYFRIMLEGKLKTNELVETTVDEISIKDESAQYTSEFVNLLKDYYLYL